MEELLMMGVSGARVIAGLCQEYLGAVTSTVSKDVSAMGLEDRDMSSCLELDTSL